MTLKAIIAEQARLPETPKEIAETYEAERTLYSLVESLTEIEELTTEEMEDNILTFKAVNITFERVYGKYKQVLENPENKPKKLIKKERKRTRAELAEWLINARTANTLLLFTYNESLKAKVEEYRQKLDAKEEEFYIQFITPSQEELVNGLKGIANIKEILDRGEDASDEADKTFKNLASFMAKPETTPELKDSLTKIVNEYEEIYSSAYDLHTKLNNTILSFGDSAFDKSGLLYLLSQYGRMDFSFDLDEPEKKKDIFGKLGKMIAYLQSSRFVKIDMDIMNGIAPSKA